jgi:hypothetical protein
LGRLVHSLGWIGWEDLVLDTGTLDCMGIVSDEDIENINLNVEIQELRQKFQNKIIFVLFRALLQRGLIKGMIWDICEM